MFENYCITYHQSIISSKLTLKNEFLFPKIKKVVIFFVINTKYYNKNMLLLYLLISICFYCNAITHNKEINNYQVVKFSLSNKKIFHYFNSFLTVYLPNLENDQNLMRKSLGQFLRKKHTFLYRINYNNFPVIPELDFICYNSEHCYNLINEYQTRFDIYLKNINFSKNASEFLLNMYRFPLNSQITIS